MIRIAAAAAVAVAFAAAPAAAQPNGKELYDLQCKFCHDDDTLGPPVTGVSGRKIASTSYSYSDALKAKADQTWTDENLDAFLKNPNEFAPGTQMQLSVPDDAARKAIIEYLKTLK